MNYEIVPASVLHVKSLSARLRPAACATLQNLGIDVRQSLRRAFVSSPYCRTVLLDGRPEAMWGMQAPALSDRAVVWAALSDTAVKFPLAVVRRARNELASMKERVGTLYAAVSKDDQRAVLFARSLGFAPHDDSDPNVLVMAMGGG